MDILTDEPPNLHGHIALYEKLRPSYEKLAEEIRYAVEKALQAAKINTSQILNRAKTIESFKEKIQRKEYHNPLEQVTDLAGVRIVCYYEYELKRIQDLIESKFKVHEKVDKSSALGVDKMGYNGRSLVVTLGEQFRGARYEDLTELKCEIQFRTVLQDSWALISHHLIYKDEQSVPQRLQRDLNNVASLMEIAQGVFDTVHEKRQAYLEEIEARKSHAPDFLAQPIDFETLKAYTNWKYPHLTISEQWHARLFADIDKKKYRTLADIDRCVNRAKPAVEHYEKQNPDWFRTGTDFVTKSLGFADEQFRSRHAWGAKTVDAFRRWEHLVQEPKI